MIVKKRMDIEAIQDAATAQIGANAAAATADMFGSITKAVGSGAFSGMGSMFGSKAGGSTMLDMGGGSSISSDSLFDISGMPGGI